MNRALPTLACALALSGCTTFSGRAGEPVPLEDLVRQIKKDIGEYNAYAAAHANDPALPNACKGKIDLTVRAVTVSVTTASKITEGVNAGAQVQPEAFLKVGVTGGANRSFANSQVLTFNLVPETVADGRAVAAQPSQLFSVLTNLRESLLRAGDTTPCLKFPEAEKDQKNSVEFGFTATKGTSAGISVNLFIFSLGASRGDERTVANKITIGFTGQGQAIQ
jgi:hypothetical protein